ncbi:MAG: YczE/YyaS/YitT family protein [Actinomycetota bacterium]
MPDRGIANLILRLVQLFVGLIVFGASLALMVRAELGLGPWDVLHQGIAERTVLQIGWVIIAVSVAVLLLWIPLRQRPGFGTVANAIVVGLAVDATLVVLSTPRSLALRAILLVAGIVANGVATGLYIGAGLGPGPRDGLMTGLALRGYSIRWARTVIEVSVLGLGWVLGGTVGIGTILFAVTIGPLAHYFIPKLDFSSTRTGAYPAGPAPRSRSNDSPKR